MICQPWIWACWLAVLSSFYHVAQATTAKLPVPPTTPIAPQVMIVSMFGPEGDVWLANFTNSGLGDLYASNISTPGISMRYPQIHCNGNQSVCQITTDMGEINAAATMMALTLSPQFDFRSTYWLIAGIGGVSPKVTTLGSVILSRFAVQVALQYEFDLRDAPENFTTGYFAIGTTGPGQYPKNIYGTEVMELNEALRDAAVELAKNAILSDSDTAKTYRDKYNSASYAATATGEPSVVKCDSATSDVYFSGKYLSEAFENVTSLWTNGMGKYCMTAQEDNASLEVLLRMAIEGRVDYSRVILMRTASDFDRAPPPVSAYDHLTFHQQNGFKPAIDNLYNAGIEIVKGILKDWGCTYKKGVIPTNYVGDILGSLGGTPDFGPKSITEGVPAKPTGAQQGGGGVWAKRRRGRAVVGQSRGNLVR